MIKNMLIAEIGVNWSSIGEFEEMLEKLSNVGVKYCKGQIFTEEYLDGRLIPQVLNYAEAKHLMEYAKELGIVLFWTPSHDDAVDLVISLKPEIIKISHKHHDNKTMADKVNKTGITTLVSIPYGWTENSLIYSNAIYLECINKYPPSDAELRSYSGTMNGVSLHSPYLTPYIKEALRGASIIEVHVMNTNDCIDAAVSLSFNDFAVLKRELDYIWGTK